MRSFFVPYWWLFCIKNRGWYTPGRISVVFQLLFSLFIGQSLRFQFFRLYGSGKLYQPGFLIEVCNFVEFLQYSMYFSVISQLYCKVFSCKSVCMFASAFSNWAISICSESVLERDCAVIGNRQQRVKTVDRIFLFMILDVWVSNESKYKFFTL